MNKTILISLAAVVVTIVIIALAALRFLRADDADPFDEIPDEPRRDRRADEDARVRETVPAAASARRPASRPAPAEESGWAPGGGDRDRADRRPDPDRGDRRPHRDRPDARPDRDQPGRDSGFRERGTQDRPAGPDRRTAGHSQPRPVPVAARQAKSARPSGQGNGTPDWDTMSDVDYWTELAADKPFSTAVEAASTQPGSAGSRRGPDQAGGPRSAGRTEQNAPLPTRSRPARPAAASAGRSAEFALPPADTRPAHAPGRYANGAGEPATESIAALARLANQAPAPQSGGQPRNSEPRPAQQRGAQPRPAQPRDVQPRDVQPRTIQPPVSQPHPQQRPLPVPLDDDPLTSPSFPAINTSDSRSYRASRPDTQPGRSAAAYGDPTQQFTAYPEAPGRAASAPNGYPAQPSAPNGYPAQPSAPPAGNPYGSFVSQPAASYQAPRPAPQDASYAGYAAQPVSGNDGWYNAPVSGTMPTPPVPSLSVPGYLPDGVVTNGYDQAAYQAAPPETAAYHQPAYPGVQYDQGGYGAQDAAYGRDAYQGYPGYGAGGY